VLSGSLNRWYQKYGLSDIVIPDTVGREPFLFRKFCFKGYIDYLGKCRNVSRTYSRKVKENVSFRAFMLSRSLSIPTTYGMAECSLPACYKSFSKYDKGEPEVRELLFRRACAWTERRYGLIMGDSKIFSQEEALAEMDKTTSCGYPWNIKYSDKNEFLESADVASVLPDFWDAIGKDCCDIQAIWKVAQKNELLPREKIEAGKVRTFTAAPIELSVAANRLFLNQNQKMNNLHVLKNSFSTSFVGATKYNGGWDHLYRHLRAKFTKAFELDESAYDSSLFRLLFEWVLKFRYSCIDKSGMTEGEQETSWRRCVHVYSSIVHSLVVLEDSSLVMKHTGNPSGSTNTINDNTLCLDVLFNYAWLCSCEDAAIETDYDHFLANVCPVYNGDDNDYTTSDLGAELLAPKQVMKHWNPIGVITKTPCETPREVKDIQFLSQEFYEDKSSGKFYPRPETDRVMSSLLLASSLQDIRWHFLRAAALRVESYWNLECRSVIYAYLCYLEQVHGSELVGEVKDLKWEHIRALYTCDDDIEALYSGKQTSNTIKWTKILRIVELLDEE